MNGPTNIFILGSTGSIGCQALEIVDRHPDRFRVTGLAAGSNVDLLVRQAQKFKPHIAIIADGSKFPTLKSGLKDSGIEVAYGEEAICDAVKAPDIDILLAATVGYSGLLPTLSAIDAGKDIALANKETLVVAGELVMRRAKENGIHIYPVDSEHSAIWQCLSGEEHDKIERLIITASGGPFLRLGKEHLKKVKSTDALRHPNWQMGRKITIDSATMMNKAFEIIEASWLFSLPVTKIDAVVHPQSIVHSMVEFEDGAVKAQLGLPDMKLPISFALAQGERLEDRDLTSKLSIDKVASLTFELPDVEKFPCLKYADLAYKKGGTTACIVNAANEVAVAAFLEDRIRFTDIPEIIDHTLDNVALITNPDLNDYIQTNREARSIASHLIKLQNWKHSV